MPTTGNPLASDRTRRGRKSAPSWAKVAGKPCARSGGMTNPGNLSGRHVLVVEDDADSRNAIRLTLEAWGANVGTASNATEALAALVARPFDVVVSDLAMPEQSGFWLITKIRQLFTHHVPVIAVTGHPFPPEGVRRAGFDDVMPKPPDPDALCAAVAALLPDPGRPAKV